MTTDKEPWEMAANSEAFELMEKFGLEMYRATTAAEVDLPKCFTNNAHTRGKSLASNTTKTTPALSKPPAAPSSAPPLKLKRQCHEVRRNTPRLERPGG